MRFDLLKIKGRQRHAQSRTSLRRMTYSFLIHSNAASEVDADVWRIVHGQEQTPALPRHDKMVKQSMALSANCLVSAKRQLDVVASTGDQAPLVRQLSIWSGGLLDIGELDYRALKLIA